jgi:hypothetical protein
MKLEKREITLNECDSLRDIRILEKSLLNEYLTALAVMERKETRECVLALIKENAEELFLAQDLLKKSLSQGIGNQ